MNQHELHELIDALLENEISEADQLRLEAELTVDPIARQEYYSRVLLTSLLESEGMNFDRNGEPSSQLAPNKPKSPVAWRIAFSLMTMLCCLLVALLIWKSDSRDPVVSAGGGVSVEEPQSQGFAILSGQSEAVWGDDINLESGVVIAQKNLHLLQGIAEIELFSGVTLVVEGESRFAILSPMEVAVESGRVRAHVPEPAQGFRLTTELGDVVDLGTEFAVDVSNDSSEVHVLDGEIEWHAEGQPIERLQAGTAVVQTKDRKTSTTARKDDFVGTAELRTRMADQNRSRFSQWEEKCEMLNTDHRLLVHYQMSANEVLGRQVTNHAHGSHAISGMGAIVAATGTTNRWGQTGHALDFSPAGSRVRLTVPGTYQNLTLACWVRINSLDRWYNSLFLTDGHEQGEPHWQIMDDGRLFFSVKKNDVFDRSKGERDKHVFYSPPFWDSTLSGRWLMLATVYDGNSLQVTHYLNGQVLSRESIPPEYLVTDIRIGDASVCNWGLPERNQPRFAVRNLNGDLDEFLLFDSPLSDAEVRQLYEEGRP